MLKYPAWLLFLAGTIGVPITGLAFYAVIAFGRAMYASGPDIWVPAMGNLVGAMLGGLLAIGAALIAFRLEHAKSAAERRATRREAIQAAFYATLLSPTDQKTAALHIAGRIEDRDRLLVVGPEFAAYEAIDDGVRDVLAVHALDTLAAFRRANFCRTALFEHIGHIRKRRAMSFHYDLMDRAAAFQFLAAWCNSHLELCFAIQRAGAIQFNIDEGFRAKLMSELNALRDRAIPRTP